MERINLEIGVNTKVMVKRYESSGKVQRRVPRVQRINANAKDLCMDVTQEKKVSNNPKICRVIVNGRS